MDNAYINNTAHCVLSDLMYIVSDTYETVHNRLKTTIKQHSLKSFGESLELGRGGKISYNRNPL